MPLPPKRQQEYFSLKEICQRWRCNESQLVDYNSEGKLEIGLILKKSKCCFENDTDVSEIDGYYKVSSSDVSRIFNDFNSLSEEDACIKKVHISKYSDAPSLYHETFADFSLNLKLRIVSNSDIFVIHRIERDRFEQEEDILILESVIATLQGKSILEKREILLNYWLIDNEIDVTKPLNFTKHDIWLALRELDQSAFKTENPESINKFFSKQNLCFFKGGRPSG